MSRFNIKDFDEAENKERFKDKRKANHERRDREERKLYKPKPNRSLAREEKGHAG